VSRNVDDRDLSTRWELQWSVAKRDRYASLLLLGQAVGVHASERIDEGALAVIDVACGAERQRCIRDLAG
jgi:hypothetical protein